MGERCKRRGARADIESLVHEGGVESCLETREIEGVTRGETLSLCRRGRREGRKRVIAVDLAIFC
jgi:hypothetical protein